MVVDLKLVVAGAGIDKATMTWHDSIMQDKVCR